MFDKPMNISTRKFLLTIVISVVLTATLTWTILPELQERIHQDNKARVNMFLHYEKFSGSSWLEVGNLITDVGENLTRNHFARGLEGATRQNVTKLAIGNETSVEQTDTALTEVYDDPSEPQYPEGTIVEWKNAGDAAYNCTFKWTFEETVTVDAAAAYFGNTTYAYSMAAIPTGAETFSSGENLTVRFVHTYNGN